MARILDTSNATAVVVQPVKAETLNFMQTAASARTNSILSSIYGVPVPSTATLYVLSGCIAITTGSTVNVTNGIVWYNGEVFEVPSATFSLPTNPNIIIFVLQTDYDTNNADPLTFSDQIQRNVHQIRTLNVTTGTSATTGYVFDFSAAIFQNLSLPALSTSIINEVNRASGVEQSLSTSIVNETQRATLVENNISNGQAFLNGPFTTYAPTISGIGTGALTNINFKYKFIGINNQAKGILISFSFTLTNGNTTSCTFTLPNSLQLAADFFGGNAIWAKFPLGAVSTVGVVADPNVSTNIITIQNTDASGSIAVTYTGQIIVEVQ